MSLATAAIESDLAISLARARQTQLSALGEEPLSWLAAVPVWNDRLARSVGFPESTNKLEDFVERADEAGLCRKRRSFGGDGEPVLHFWMQANARADVVDWLGQRSRREMRQLTFDLASRLEKQAGGNTETAPCVYHWIALAAEARDKSEEAAGQLLNREVARLAGEHDTATSLDLVAAAESLAAVLGGSLEAAVPRARRRIGLEYRVQQDETLLRYFLSRSEPLDAAEALLGGPDNLWALHIAGAGGVGKTMFIRFLANRYAKQRSQPYAVSRVDFDHLPPLYPARKPGQLLLELADELFCDVTMPKQERQFERLLEQVTRAHEDIGSLRTGEVGQARIMTPAMGKALDAFASLCRSLDRPVLLILDTCEELAKVRIGGQGIRAVDATFVLLEQLHKRMPSLRVLFAGRRPLANCGAGDWSYDSSMAGPGALGDLRKRDYLMLQELRAFSREEVVTYLTDVHGKHVSDDDLERLLESSPEPGRLVGLRTPATDDRPRYNPMDIEMFIFGGDPDGYISDRVIGRLEEYERHLLPALPAIALLGRFDAAMIAPVLEGQGTSPSDVLSGLAQQEWVAISGGRDPSTWFLEVKPGVLDRLRRHFESEMPEVAARLARHLAELVEQGVLADQPLDYAVEAIRMLPPLSAASLWDRITVKATDAGQWEWVRALAEQVLAPDDRGQVPPSVQAIGAAILATSIAAIRHGDREWDPSAQWAEVAEEAGLHPDQPTRAWLEVRSRLGRLTGAALAQHHLTRAELEQFLVDLTTLVPEDNDRDHSLGPALVSALNAVLELPGIGDAVLPEHVWRFLDAWRPTLDGGLLAFTLCLSARVVARHESIAEARPLFVEAEQVAVTPLAGIRDYADWVAPDSLVDRIQLEWLLCASTSEHMLQIGPAPGDWTAQAADRATTIDGERLVSLLLLRSMDTEVPEADRLERLEAADAYAGERRSACVAHDRVAPLFISLARAWVARGDIGRALTLLDLREGQALSQRSARPDSETARAAEACVTDVVRRMRIRSRIAQVDRFARDRDLAPRSWAARSLVLSPAEASIDRPDSTERLHAWYRCLPTALDAASARDALTGSDPNVWLDSYEAELAAAAVDMPSSSPPDGATLAARLGTATTDLHSDPADLLPDDESSRPLRLQLRAWALDLPDAVPPVIASHRRAAELALDEGELLALRLPELGARLLAYALKRYEMAGDPVGTVITGTALVLALRRSGRAADARAALDNRVRTAYERLEFGLPEWQSLASKGAPAAIVSAPDGWIGWLTRLQTCLAAPAKAPRIVKEPQAAEFGLSSPLDRAQGARPHGRAKRWTMILIGLILAVSTVGIGVAIWKSRFGTIDLGLALSNIAYYGFLIWLTGYLIHKGTLLFVSVAGAAPNEEATINARLVLRPAPSNRVTRWLGIASLSLLWPYYLMAKALAWRRPGTAAMRAGMVEEGSVPRALRRRLRRRLLFRRPVKTAVIVDAPLASLPWEASLRVPLGDRAAANPFRVIRGGPVPPADTWASPAVGTPSAASWQLLLEESWAPLTKSVKPWLPPLPPLPASVAPLFNEATIQQPVIAVLHVVATPVLTTTGWRLRLDDKRPDKVGPNAPTQGGQTLIGPEALASTGASLVVIEAPPTGALIEIDRESADGLRQLATEVVAAGAYAALAMPELPPEVAKSAIGVLARGLRRSRRVAQVPNAKKLVSIVGKMRAAVVGSAAERDTTRREASAVAMDLCLIVSERQPGRSPYLKPPVPTRRIAASPTPLASLPLLGS